MNTNIKIQHKEGFFTAFEGQKLYEQWWFPSGISKATIVIVHGYAEHSGRYEHVANYFGNHGCTVGTFDLRAHGKSEGKNTIIRSFDHFLEDLDIFLSRAREQAGGIPLFLLGHSMGAGIVTKYAITHQPKVNGLLLSGVTAKIGDDIHPFMIKLVEVLGAILPKMPTIKL
ncbi:MAG: alpha/beta hydrolase, partial [Anaerolineaceae bacterium]|nr:alpha/beta hydrolase [Anaerolineaceae bacterium]